MNLDTFNTQFDSAVVSIMSGDSGWSKADGAPVTTLQDFRGLGIEDDDFHQGLRQIRAGWDLQAAGVCDAGQEEKFLKGLSQRVFDGQDAGGGHEFGAEVVAVLAVNQFVPRSERTQAILDRRAAEVEGIRASLG